VEFGFWIVELKGQEIHTSYIGLICLIGSIGSADEPIQTTQPMKLIKPI